MKKNNSGFTLIEVLVATLIMVMSIVTVTAAIRQFAIHREKLKSYERIYSTVLSLRARIMNDTLKEDTKDSGTFNGLNYSYQCQLVESANNFVFGEEGDMTGNKGPFLISLFRVNLEVDGKDVEFFKTQYKRRYAAAQNGL